MEDRALVAAIVSGDPRGLDGAYRRYAARLYAYARSLLRDGEAAADVVQDTFVIAARQAGQIRDADRLAAWLYAIARNECRRHARTRSRHVPLDLALVDGGDTPDHAAALHARDLVHAAADALGDGDREVIDLALRHGLAAPDMAGVLGMPLNQVHARLSRARAGLERAIGILLVARAGGRDCPALAETLVGWDGRLTPLLRKRIGRHVDACASCSDRRGRLASPAALLAMYAAGPFTVAAGVLAGPDALTPASHSMPLDGRTGFPRRTLPAAAGSGLPPRARWGLVAAALLALLMLGTVTALAVGTGSGRAGNLSPSGTPAGSAPDGPGPTGGPDRSGGPGPTGGPADPGEPGASDGPGRSDGPRDPDRPGGRDDPDGEGDRGGAGEPGRSGSPGGAGSNGIAGGPVTDDEDDDDGRGTRPPRTTGSPTRRGR